METITTDVLIIGSGFGAAPPALRLAEQGLSVTVLEKGPHIDAPGDFRQTQDPTYFLDYFHNHQGRNIGMTYVEALGGASGFYEMVSLRAPSVAFDARDVHGRRVWPSTVTRAALDPYYQVAERMLNVHQIPIAQIPKSGLLFSRMMKNLGYSCDRAAYAIRGCVGSGFCVAGCIYGAKQSLHFNYIPRAVAAGALFRTGIDARRIRRTSAPVRTDQAMPPMRYDVECRESESGNDVRYRARILVLAGGTLGSARILLRSRRDLPGLSSAIGTRVSFNGGVKTAGLLGDDWPDGDMFTGRSHPGMISYEFLESHGITLQAAKPLPLQAVAAARLTLPAGGAKTHWGADHAELMKQYRHRMVVLFALGLTPPTAKLEWSRGKMRLSLELSDDLREYYRRTKALLHSIYERNGCRPVQADFVDSNGEAHEDLHFDTSHQVGSCAMADSREAGVVDANGEAFGLPGLFVTDGAAIPGSIAVSTSLTILANAERISAGIVAKLGQGGRPRVAPEPAISHT